MPIACRLVEFTVECKPDGWRSNTQYRKMNLERPGIEHDTRS